MTRNFSVELYKYLSEDPDRAERYLLEPEYRTVVRRLIEQRVISRKIEDKVIQKMEEEF